MKKLLIILSLLSVGLFADISWQKDIPAALELAKKENKTLMVFVEGENCRWCKKMKHRILSDESVEKRLQSYVCVKVFRENKEAVKDLPEIEGVPSVFFMKADKTVLITVLGYFNVEDFTSYIDSVEKKLSK